MLRALLSGLLILTFSLSAGSQTCRELFFQKTPKTLSVEQIPYEVLAAFPKVMSIFTDANNVHIRTARNYLKIQQETKIKLPEEQERHLKTLDLLYESIIQKKPLTDRFIYEVMDAYLFISLLPKAHRAAQERGLSFVEKVALATYTSDDYKIINASLRSKHPSQEVLFFAEQIKSALKKFPVYKGPVKRGTLLSAEDLAKIKENEPLSFPYFLSTTKDFSFNKFENKHRLIIESKSGRDISEFTMNTAEKEILFLPDTPFTVEKMETNVRLEDNGPLSEIQITLSEK